MSNISEYYEQYWLEDDYRRSVPADPFLVRAIVETLPAGSRCLDVGCGNGGLGSALSAHNIQHSGVDISAAGIEIARSRGVPATQIEDASELPFSDGEFGAIVYSEVLEHLFSPQLALAEASRVLRSRGVIFVTVPNVAFWRFRLELLAGWFNPFGDNLSRVGTLARSTHSVLHKTKSRGPSYPFRFRRRTRARRPCGLLMHTPFLRRFFRTEGGALYRSFEARLPSLLGVRPRRWPQEMIRLGGPHLQGVRSTCVSAFRQRRQVRRAAPAVTNR